MVEEDDAEKSNIARFYIRQKFGNDLPVNISKSIKD